MSSLIGLSTRYSQLTGIPGTCDTIEVADFCPNKTKPMGSEGQAGDEWTAQDAAANVLGMIATFFVCVPWPGKREKGESMHA